ncbi:MAG: transcriptional regulator [Desulfobacteraceae bacterium 4572_35.1]|nr:MAG: transcriptional regulator [Desulfobacteraceae bacterium 4572_35.1]
MSTENGNCQIEFIHKENVNAVITAMETDDVLFQVAELLKAFGDPTRIKIIHALSFSELCVCDLACLLNMSSSAVSHQLRVLRGQKIVQYRKDGKNAIYFLADPHMAKLLGLGLEHAMG